MTEYLIFRAQALSGEHPPTGWKQVGRETARSTSAALRAYFDAFPESDPGEAVAVPVRSWRPVSVKVETKTALKFS